MQEQIKKDLQVIKSKFNSFILSSNRINRSRAKISLKNLEYDVKNNFCDKLKFKYSLERVFFSIISQNKYWNSYKKIDNHNTISKLGTAHIYSEIEAHVPETLLIKSNKDKWAAKYKIDVQELTKLTVDKKIDFKLVIESLKNLQKSLDYNSSFLKGYVVKSLMAILCSALLKGNVFFFEFAHQQAEQQRLAISLAEPSSKALSSTQDVPIANKPEETPPNSDFLLKIGSFMDNFKRSPQSVGFRRV